MDKTVDLEQILKNKNESLYYVLKDIEKCSIQIWNDRLLPWFTNHNVGHSKEIIHILGQIVSPLISNDDFLSDHELFILLASAYLHDIGMQNLKIEQISIEQLTEKEYNQIRKRHAEESYNIILSKTKLVGRDDFHLPASLEENYILPIALVSKGHSTDYFEEVIAELQKTPLTPGNRLARVDMLTALLMIADELDLQNKRINFSDLAKFTLSPYSLLHWYKHHYVDFVEVDACSIKLNLNFPENSEDYQELIEELIVGKLKKQIAKINPILKRVTNNVLRLDTEIDIQTHIDTSGVKRELPKDVLMELKKSFSEEALPQKSNYDSHSSPLILPKPSPIFTGRKVELKQFRDAFTTHNFISIEGFGGIGKTEFAAKCIEEFCSKGSLVWFDCLPDSKLDTLIDFAGYKDVLKGENKTELAKYSGFVDLIERDKKTLFLDNFQDALDKSFNDFFVFAERRLRDAKFIFISREHPQLRIKTVPVPLEGLKDDSFAYAKKLISNYYRDTQVDDGALKILCDKLDGHPLAIDFALQLIRYGESPTDIIPKIAKFKGSELSNRLLAEVFDHPKSTAVEKKLLLRFSVFRRDVDKNGLIYIMDGENIDETVRVLIDKKMLAISQQNLGCYNTHPLIREFCYLRLDSNEKNDTHIKVANYLTNGRSEKFDHVLEEEIFHHYYAAKSLEDAANIILQKGEAFILSGHTNSLKTMMDNLISSGVEKTLFDIYYGDIATIHGEWDHALRHFEKASSSDDEKIMAEAYIKFGDILYRKGSVKESLKYFEDAYSISEKKGYKKEQARALNNIGRVCTTHGNLKEH